MNPGFILPRFDPWWQFVANQVTGIHRITCVDFLETDNYDI